MKTQFYFTTKTVTATLTVSVADGVRLVRSSDNSTVAVGVPEKLGGEVSLDKCSENYMLDILKEQRYNVLECLSAEVHDNWDAKTCSATWIYSVADATSPEEPEPASKVSEVEKQTPVVEKTTKPTIK